jgi:hypothetical protein
MSSLSLLGPNIHKNIGNTSKQLVDNLLLACSSYPSTLKTEAVSCFEMSVKSYQITRRGIAKDSTVCGLSNLFRNELENQFLIRNFCVGYDVFGSIFSFFDSSRACASVRISLFSYVYYRLLYCRLGQMTQGVTSHLHLVPSLRMRGVAFLGTSSWQGA